MNSEPILTNLGLGVYVVQAPLGTGGLWVADLDSGQRQRLLPDFQMRHYTISADGQRVVFVASEERGHAPVWLASLNGPTAAAARHR